MGVSRVGGELEGEVDELVEVEQCGRIVVEDVCP